MLQNEGNLNLNFGSVCVRNQGGPDWESFIGHGKSFLVYSTRFSVVGTLYSVTLTHLNANGHCILVEPQVIESVSLNLEKKPVSEWRPIIRFDRRTLVSSVSVEVGYTIRLLCGLQPALLSDMTKGLLALRRMRL